MSTYSIKLLTDNAEICRATPAIFTDFIGEALTTRGNPPFTQS